VCKQPCIDEVKTVEVIPGPMPTTPTSYTPATGRIQSTTFAQNQGANAQQVTVAFAFAQQLSSSVKFGTKFSYQEKVKVKLGLPFFSEKGAREGRLLFRGGRKAGGRGACVMYSATTTTISIARASPHGSLYANRSSFDKR
jgi:hypothetical protein